MFTGVAQKNKGVAKTYFDEHLSHNDYYTQGEVEVGRWIGLGGERLGLLEGQPVNRQAFMDLCDNLHPTEKNRLTQRQGGEGDRRIFFDFTCSAPKSVSIMAVTMDDQRILQAHQQAARTAAKELERFAATRIRVKGANEDRATGNLIGAEFLHNSSRALDPQLHTHFTLFNATWDSTERKWKALQPSGLFAASQYGTEVYRNELAKKLIAIGYKVENQQNGFDISGVSPELIKRFSKRAAERDRVIAEMEARLKRKLTKDEVSVAVHRTRSRKLKGITTEEVRQRQLDQMSPAEIATLQKIKAQAQGVRQVGLDPKANGEEAALKFAAEHAFERASVVPQEELLRHALIHARGEGDLDKLKDSLGKSEKFIRVGNSVSTREILATELHLIQTLNSGKDSLPPLAAAFTPAAKLEGDQRQALAHVLNSPDQFTGIRGLAGTGKTTTLSELDRALKQSGHVPVFCAPTASGTEVLQKDGFSSAITLARLLVDQPLQAELTSRSVIVLDEAGLVGLQDMKKLFAVATEHGARVVFSGDTRQHTSVAGGDALRILEEHSRYSFGELSQIRRQKEADYRQVVELAANHQPQAAFDKLESLGAVTEPTKLFETAAAVYLQARERGQSALLIAPTWNDIEAVNQCVRDTLKKEGTIAAKKEEVVGVFDALGWTPAQKQNGKLYAPGMRILFQQASGSFKQNELIEVLRVDGTQLQIRRENGTEGHFRPKTGTSFEVGQWRHIPVAPGDQLLLQANRVTEKIVNGQQVTVKAVEKNRITLTDGRTLPQNYHQFCHGYCLTSYASQGKTADSVFLVASSRSAGAIHREQFYVSISRGRNECHIMTDDKLLLRQNIARSTQRQAAVELIRLAMEEQGLVPKASPLLAPRPTARMRPLPRLHRTEQKQRVPVYQNVAEVSRKVTAMIREVAQRLQAQITLKLEEVAAKKKALRPEPQGPQVQLAPEVEPHRQQIKISLHHSQNIRQRGPSIGR